MATKIEKRENVNPEEGIHKYGHVEFADPVNNKYPIDTAEHVRAAWSYINHPNDADKYDAQDVKTIKERIKKAAKKFGVEITSDEH
ncbi:MAG: hypothetical protein IT338_01335 [Thermomicrobiales bacterium]|nr:hypothetical protein [Thermomicrobiales bacterium]